MALWIADTSAGERYSCASLVEFRTARHLAGVKYLLDAAWNWFKKF